jgi:hypothetical protein
MDRRKEELDLHNSECHPTETTQADMQEENQELKRMVQKLKGDVTKAAQQEANARALAEKANEGKVKAAAKVKSAKLALEREKKKRKAGTPSKRKAPLPSQPGPGNANQSAEAEGLAKQANQDAGLWKGALKQSEKNATEWMKMALYQQRSEQSRAYSKEVLLPMVNASPNSAAKLIPAVAAETTEGKYPLPFLVRSVGAKALFGMLLFSESCPYCRSEPWRVSR